MWVSPLVKDPLKWQVLGGSGFMGTQACSLENGVHDTKTGLHQWRGPLRASATHPQGQLLTGALCMMVTMTVANIYQLFTSARHLSHCIEYTKS